MIWYVTILISQENWKIMSPSFRELWIKRDLMRKFDMPLCDSSRHKWQLKNHRIEMQINPEMLSAITRYLN